MSGFPRRDRPARLALLALAGLLLPLLALEGSLRLFGFAPRPLNRSYVWRFPDEGPGPRDPLEPAPPADRRPLICCLGDSFTYGMGVPRDRTWPALLERELGGGARVVNLGEPGSGPVEQEETLRRCLDLGPRAVVLGALINDALDARQSLERGRRLPALEAPRRWLLQHTALFPFLEVLGQRLRGVPMVFDRRNMTSRDLRRMKFAHYHHTTRTDLWERLVFPRWRAMRDRCAAAGVRFAMVLFPVDVQFDREAGIDPGRIFDTQAHILAFAAGEGIPVLDLAPAFREALDAGGLRLNYSEEESRRLGGRLFDSAPPALYLNDGHPAPAACLVTAREVARRLTDLASSGSRLEILPFRR